MNGTADLNKKGGSPSPFERGQEKETHLLVIRLSAMGDVAMTVPVLLGLTQQHPELKITVLTKGFLSPLFSQIPNVSVYIADVKKRHKGILGLYKLYKELKGLGLNQIADLHNVLRSNVLKVFFKLGGFSFEQIDKGRSEKKKLTSGSQKELKALKSSHQRYADVFKKLGYAVDLKNVTLLNRSTISTDVKNQLNLTSKVKIGIAPFAAFQGKTYPSVLMEEVLNRLNKTDRYQILLFGGGNAEIQQFTSWEEKYSRVQSVAGKYSFEEELQIISNLDLMLSMDSGNGHLAANYGVHVLTLWGITHPSAGFVPFNQDASHQLLADRTKFPLIPTSIYGNKMPEGYDKAMETISPEKVVATIEYLFSSVL